ncbi:hypothetical protein EZS27_030682 [termite gut metagenome]|uniref:Uncharacterized protein n=1 Tax=termite gut metagenome TaxID=433724 RepID=A0A5J4QD11_9ZZZZ
MRFSDLPENPEMVIPESQKNWILQVIIPFGDNYIRLSDCGGGYPLNEEKGEVGIIKNIVKGIINNV